MSVVLLVIMATDLLMFRAGLDGIGRFERVQATVLSIHETQHVQRTSRSGNQGAIYNSEPALVYSFQSVVGGETVRFSRVFLLGGAMEVPRRVIEASDSLAKLKVGDAVTAYYYPATGVAFVQFGLLQALKFWGLAFGGFAVLFALGGGMVALGNAAAGSRQGAPRR